MRLSAAAAGTVLVMAGALAVPARAQPADPGERAFQKCYACHSVDPAETGLPGPNLAGIFGRRAGSAKDFDYSVAMRTAGAKGLVWTRTTLDRFLADPEAVVPGTSMARPHLESERERRAVIEYLTTHRQPTAMSLRTRRNDG